HGRLSRVVLLHASRQAAVWLIFDVSQNCDRRLVKRFMSPQSPKAKFSAFELRPQTMYRVVVAFADYDKGVHEVGEHWKFLRKSFLPYEDGLSLFVERGSGQETQIRLQCRPERAGRY